MPRNIDLNLIPALRALLEERSVSKAAQRMNMSQPALSASLSRLRIHFSDELLVRTGNRYEYKLTPLGAHLLERVYLTEISVERLFAAQDFDPATSKHVFVVATSDYTMAVLGGSLATVMRRSAPHVSLRFEPLTTEIVHRAPESLRDIAGVLMPHGYIPAIQGEFLDVFADRWVIVASESNSEVGDTLTLEELAVLPWVSSSSTPTQLTPPERQLRLLGLEPIVEIGVPGFLAIEKLVSGTNRIAFLPGSYASRIAESHNLRVLECPFDAAPLREMFAWSSIHTHLPEHIWFRARLSEAASEADLISGNQSVL